MVQLTMFVPVCFARKGGSGRKDVRRHITHASGWYSPREYTSVMEGDSLVLTAMPGRRSLTENDFRGP
jgi:hypothetical protein